LNLSKIQAEIQNAVRAYAQSRIKPSSRDFESAGAFRASLFVEFAAALTEANAGSDASETADAVVSGAIQTLGG